MVCKKLEPYGKEVKEMPRYRGRGIQTAQAQKRQEKYFVKEN
jgi:hypothetical protein